MTLHTDLKDVHCKKCNSVFMPFKKDFKCPNCGEATDKFYDFIPEIISAMHGHKNNYGSYFPPAWATMCFADYVESIVFKLFDCIEADDKIEPEAFIKKSLADSDWGDQKYMQKHLEEIALAVLDDYRANRKSYERKIFSKSKPFWRNFIP